MLDFIGNDVGNLKNYSLCIYTHNAAHNALFTTHNAATEVLLLVLQEECVRAGKRPESGN